jgi:hypothetical protein
MARRRVFDPTAISVRSEKPFPRNRFLESPSYTHDTIQAFRPPCDKFGDLPSISWGGAAENK